MQIEYDFSSRKHIKTIKSKSQTLKSLEKMLKRGFGKDKPNRKYWPIFYNYSNTQCVLQDQFKASFRYFIWCFSIFQQVIKIESTTNGKESTKVYIIKKYLIESFWIMFKKKCQIIIQRELLKRNDQPFWMKRKRGKSTEVTASKKRSTTIQRIKTPTSIQRTPKATKLI